MKLLIFFILWCLLLWCCWPLAVLALVAFPLICLIALVFRLVAMVLEALLAFLKAVLFLPARLLGYRGG